MATNAQLEAMDEAQVAAYIRSGAADAVTYQVTATKPGEAVQVIAKFDNGYDAGEFARRFFTTRAASGKVVTVRRDDGKPV
jgi:hypothetical protein